MRFHGFEVQRFKYKRIEVILVCIKLTIAHFILIGINA